MPEVKEVPPVRVVKDEDLLDEVCAGWELVKDLPRELSKPSEEVFRL
ncbi:MAG: hypothetical protein AAGC74_09315 [Verrucomicrobiota bacterium]